MGVSINKAHILESLRLDQQRTRSNWFGNRKPDHGFRFSTDDCGVSPYMLRLCLRYKCVLASSSVQYVTSRKPLHKLTNTNPGVAAVRESDIATLTLFLPPILLHMIRREIAEASRTNLKSEQRLKKGSEVLRLQAPPSPSHESTSRRSFTLPSFKKAPVQRLW